MLYDDLFEKMQGKPYVGYFAAWCPFDEHKSPALLVYPDGYYCRSCNKGGSLESMAKKIGINYVPKREYKVIPQFKRWLEYENSLEEIALSAHKFLRVNKSYQKYLRNRKAEQWIEPGLLGFKDGWITIPVRDQNNKIVDIICRGISKEKTRYVLLRGDGEPHLYCPDWERANKACTVYIPIGIFDAWSLWELGYAVVTGTTGTSLSAELIKPLRKEYIIIPDKGEEKQAYHLEASIGWRAQVKRLVFPPKTKDVDEVRREYGKTALLNLLEA